MELCLRPNLLFLELDEETALELERVLPGNYRAVKCSLPSNAAGFLQLLQEWRPEVLFCPARHRHLVEMLEKAGERKVRVVVVTRHPDAREWVDAMDAGASDYLAAPFQARQISWVLQASVVQPA